MKKRSKRYQEALKKIDKNKLYPLAEAISLVKETGKTKFSAKGARPLPAVAGGRGSASGGDSSVEVHIRLGIDPKKADQMARGTILFPHGLGKERRIIAFVSPEKEQEAKDAGADIIGDESAIKKIKETKRCDFDIAIAQSQVMKNLGQIAKILGPKGLMPNPKTETITNDIKKTIGELRKGKAMFRSDDSGNLHQLLGKLSFDHQKIMENFIAFLDAVKKAKPEGVKGTYIRSIHLASSMGPSVKVAL